MDLFNFVKQQTDIVAVIGEYTSLKKTGAQYWKARCPFHYENTPSFTVSPHKGIFYCFGCHVTGDAIGFIEKIEHLNAFQAAQHLIERYSIDVPESLQKTFVHKRDKSSVQLCGIVATWCNNYLFKHPAAFNYLKQRSISKQTIMQYMIGYFPAGSRGIAQLLEHVTPLGFSSQDLVDANIVYPGKQGLYSPYEDRIIFVIKDHLGHVCGFGGRIFLPHDTRVKYYNSKESEHFKKGKILFGFDLAKSEIQKQQAAMIVEGYMDCIALHQLGFKNVVATLGTACNAEHLQQLAKHASRIYLLYDADPAGKQAIVRLTALCWQMDLDVKVVNLPAGTDPANLLEQGADVQGFIDQAQDIFDFFLHEKSDGFGQESMKHKMGIVHELFELVGQIKDSLRQNILLMKMAESLQIPLEIIKKEYTNRYKKHTTENSVPSDENRQSSGNLLVDQSNQSSIDRNDQQILEEQIMAILIHDGTLLTEKYKALLTAALSSEWMPVFEKIVDCLQQSKKIQLADVIDLCNSESKRRLSEISFVMDSSKLAQSLHAVMIKFQKKYWKAVIGHFRHKIMQAQKQQDKQEVQRLISVFEELKVELM